MLARFPVHLHLRHAAEFNITATEQHEPFSWTAEPCAVLTQTRADRIISSHNRTPQISRNGLARSTKTCRISVPSTDFNISPDLTPAALAGEPGANPAQMSLLLRVNHKMPKPAHKRAKRHGLGSSSRAEADKWGGSTNPCGTSVEDSVTPKEAGSGRSAEVGRKTRNLTIFIALVLGRLMQRSLVHSSSCVSRQRGNTVGHRSRD